MPGGAPAGDASFLEVVDLARSFGGVRAVDGVSLSLQPGEARCLVGPNGCGKTTLFNLLTGYLVPTSGTIRFRGQPISGRPLHEVAALGIVRKFQVPSVFPGLSVADNLQAASAGRPLSVAVARLRSGAGLDREFGRPAGTLAHGQKQWLELAMVFAAGPRLVLLDEPAAGMTAAEKRETVRLIGRIREETGVALLVIEHDMSFVEALGCPVSVMVMGRIMASGSLDLLRRDAAVRAAYLGERHD